jgi:hypothetical protein
MYYIPTYPPARLFTYSPTTYLPIHPPIFYNLPTFILHNLVVKCQNKHVKLKSNKIWTPFDGVVHWLKTWFIISEVKGSISNIITYVHA